MHNVTQHTKTRSKQAANSLTRL